MPGTAEPDRLGAQCVVTSQPVPGRERWHRVRRTEGDDGVRQVQLPLNQGLALRSRHWPPFHWKPGKHRNAEGAILEHTDLVRVSVTHPFQFGFQSGLGFQQYDQVGGLGPC